MAWIETNTNAVVNLDVVEYLNIEWLDGYMTLWANTESEHPIWTEESSGGKEQAERFRKLMEQIAKAARENAYISQDDVKRMMNSEV